MTRQPLGNILRGALRASHVVISEFLRHVAEICRLGVHVPPHVFTKANGVNIISTRFAPAAGNFPIGPRDRGRAPKRSRPAYKLGVLA